jgi:serine/threonine-protein kinase
MATAPDPCERRAARRERELFLRGPLPSCPRCLRALPDLRGVCVYCGAPLGPSPVRTPPGLKRVPGGLVGTTVEGRFLIEELIGQGGMGEVYRARHLALDRAVVLKMLKRSLLEDPTLVGRFEREAKAASRLNHPNVIQVLDFGRTGREGTLYIVMEHVDGKDLRVVLRDEWPLAEERLCHMMAQVCAALSEAHAHNVIHRDLKPENIMVQERRGEPDFVKVLDFGIAKILDHEGTGPILLPNAEPQQRIAALTRHDVVCGTPQYMAPEQATGAHLDARSDLYAVGVILYQMTTGHLPFDGPTSMEILTRHVNEPPVPPRERQPDAPISEAMEEMILRALEKDPARRPQNAEQFREELLAVPVRARARQIAAEPAPPEPRRAARRLAPLIAGVARAGAARAAIARRFRPATG